MPELGEKRKRTFGVVHKYGTKKLTHTTSLIGRNASNSRAQITPSDTNENEWANVVESPFVMRKRKRTDERAKKWAELLPFLTEAYIQGYGVQVPVPQSLKATDDVFLTCACKEKKSTYVTTVYKCDHLLQELPRTFVASCHDESSSLSFDTIRSAARHSH
ncbi:hypothetical protein BDB00DRAFT_158290 [Zychaea mexicana]|uniref:uncharacterized protein n=1 Tax=Zychaea mexicana TaxID=64656 RepID=UPI0022FE7377|nr:uncharacterized protein BDB00DRAFT_158290 [Zychaea mexicana]KAI9484290.1 hypothetical protein BDB00DRAFT_158290 [Zychaea mexicana]